MSYTVVFKAWNGERVRTIKAVNERQAWVIARSIAKKNKWIFNNQVRKVS